MGENLLGGASQELQRSLGRFRLFQKIAYLNERRLPPYGEEASPTAGIGGGDFPVCLNDYAHDENVIARVDPILTEHRL